MSNCNQILGLTRKEIIVVVILAIAIVIAFVLIKNGCSQETPRALVDNTIDGRSALRFPVPLPDFTVVEHNNPYGIQGLGDIISIIDSATAQYICPLANTGTACFSAQRFNMPKFLEIKILKISDGWFWEGYKGSYDLASVCLVDSLCIPCNESSPDSMYLGIWQFDTYFNDIKLHGRGSYISEVTVNAANQFAELNTKNNVYFFGFNVTFNGSVWQARSDSTIVTQKLKEKIKHL